MSHYSEAEIEMLERRDARPATEHTLHRLNTLTNRWEPINATPLTYLACPYSHPKEAVKALRFIACTRATAWLMTNYAWNVFSPITHSHPLHSIAGLRGDWVFWKKIDTEYIHLSGRLVVLVIPGWRESIGVTAEIEIAKSVGIPVYYLNVHGPDNYSLDNEPLENAASHFDR